MMGGQMYGWGMVRRPHLKWETRGWDSAWNIKILLHISVAFMAPRSTRSHEWKESVFFFPSLQLFIKKNFNCMEKLKELYSEHAYTWHQSGIQVLLLPFYSAGFIRLLSIHQSILFRGAFHYKLQTSIPFTLNTQHRITCQSSVLVYFFFREMDKPWVCHVCEFW